MSVYYVNLIAHLSNTNAVNLDLNECRICRHIFYEITKYLKGLIAISTGIRQNKLFALCLWLNVRDS